MRLSWCFLISMFGCGDVSVTPDSRAIDSPNTPDSPRTLMCDPVGTFDPPVALAGFATTALDETSVHLSPDELTLYVTMNPATSIGAHDIYSAQRASTSDVFGMPMSVTAANSTAEDYDSMGSADGMTMSFHPNRVANQGYHLYVATRGSTLAQFGSASLLAGVQASDTTKSDCCAYITADGQELWFNSDRTGNLETFRA